MWAAVVRLAVLRAVEDARQPVELAQQHLQVLRPHRGVHRGVLALAAAGFPRSDGVPGAYYPAGGGVKEAPPAKSPGGGTRPDPACGMRLSGSARVVRGHPPNA